MENLPYAPTDGMKCNFSPKVKSYPNLTGIWIDTSLEFTEGNAAGSQPL